MLTKLYKLAYMLDQKGLYTEADEIEIAMKEMAERARLNVGDLVALADELDTEGHIELAEIVDGIVKEAAKKKKLKYWEGKNQKPPVRHDIKKAPKSWFDEKKKELKKKNPDYSDKRLNSIISDIWFNEMSDNKRNKVWKELGRKGMAQK